ncbi:hypothetical protein ACH4GK_34950 [Streptomyces rimosus]|nr:hypothetical protein [Streptomyces rimosus]
MKTVPGSTDHVPRPGGLLEHNGYRIDTGPTTPHTDAAAHGGER